MKRALLLFIVACSSPRSAPQPSTTTANGSANASTASVSAPVPKAVEDAGIDAAKEKDEEKTEADPSYEHIVDVLGITAAACTSLVGDAKIRCAIDERWKGDTKAQSLANELWAKWRIIPGVEVAHTMDGGYRGNIRIAPAVPLNEQRKHIEWIVSAMRDIDQFFDDLAREGGRKTAKRYRFKPIELRFMKSLDGKRTPSAYAHDWTVAWNLEGSLNVSADAARETLVHEIFHLNDRAHGKSTEDWWSPGALGTEFNFAVAKCGTATACLTPFTPNETQVRGGTYYSFQPGNGVVEYAAELALRYYREQRAIMRKLPKVKPFKCGPAQNARAWTAMRDEFFDGIDLVPACP